MFKKKYQELLKLFEKGKTMVLSTSYNDIVSSRMMSVVEIKGLFYFQTDSNFRKFQQLLNNENCALCIDNIQIEGTCKQIGKPKDNKAFTKVFKRNFEGSYKAYSNLENEVLFVVEPKYIQRWLYIDGKSFIEKYYLNEERYELEEY